jgi:hypothetical protein
MSTCVYDATKHKPSYYHDTPQSWGTWDGRSLTLGELEHQHLSNIYWFNVVMHNRVYTFAINELEKRFNGILLAYRPDIRFDHEITKLEKKGLLVWNRDKSHGHVVLNGNVIGEVLANKVEKKSGLDDIFDDL